MESYREQQLVLPAPGAPFPTALESRMCVALRQEALPTGAKPGVRPWQVSHGQQCSLTARCYSHVSARAPPHGMSSIFTPRVDILSGGCCSVRHAEEGRGSAACFLSEPTCPSERIGVPAYGHGTASGLTVPSPSVRIKLGSFYSVPFAQRSLAGSTLSQGGCQV